MFKSYLTIIKNHHFRHLWFAQIASQIALNMLIFVLAIRVYEKTQSNTAVSLIMLSYGIPSIIFGTIAGSIVDFFDKRRILLFCNLSRVIALLFIFFFQGSILAIFLLIVAISIVTQLFIPAEASSIPFLLASSDILAGNSLFAVSFYLSTVTGFILSGLMIDVFGGQNVYLVIALLMSAASYFVFLLPKVRSDKKSLEPGFDLNIIGKTIEEGLKFIKSSKRVAQSLILLTFSQALISTLAVLAPGFADKVLGILLSSASYIVMGPAAVGLIVGAMLTGGYGGKFLKGSIILTGIMVIAIDLIFLSFTTRLNYGGNLAIVFLLLFVLGVANSFISVPANTILQEDSKSEMRGRVYGVVTALTGGASLLPVISSGLLADVIGVGRTMSIIGFVVLMIGIYNFLQRRKAMSMIK